MATGKILVVEDEPIQLKLLLRQLEGRGYEAEGCSSAKEALERYKDDVFDLVITDFSMPGMNGLELLREMKRLNSEARVILVTGYGTIDVAVSAMKKGALDFLTKPYNWDVLFYTVERAFRMKSLEEEAVRLHMELMDRYCFDSIVGGSPPMKKLFKEISNISMGDATCLIEGESGAGKELIARAIHYEGPRRNKPFIAVSCRTTGENPLEIELFGLEKGAFHGVANRHIGKLEQAREGTLFLDEVGELESELQLKILSFLRKKEFERIGGPRPIAADVRIIASTSYPLESLVRDGRFEGDLFSHLKLFQIQVPSLRARKEDIPLFVRYFFTQYGLPGIRVDNDVMEVFMRYDWPGNVRELKNIIERMIIMSPRVKTLHVADLPLEIRAAAKVVALQHPVQ